MSQSCNIFSGISRHSRKEQGLHQGAVQAARLRLGLRVTALSPVFYMPHAPGEAALLRHGACTGRTTIADGNTWNHEHIATLGRTLTSEAGIPTSQLVSPRCAARRNRSQRVEAALPREQRCDVLKVKRAHNTIRHLADYVLVWGGGQPLSSTDRWRS